MHLTVAEVRGVKEKPKGQVEYYKLKKETENIVVGLRKARAKCHEQMAC